MKIDKARRIAIAEILRKISGKTEWDEDTISEVSEYLKYYKEDHTRQDVLRWLETMNNTSPYIRPLFEQGQVGNNLTVLRVEALGHPALFNYIVDRGIDLHVAMKYLDEVTVRDNVTGKTFTAIGFKNDENGYEVINRTIKGRAGNLYPTFIRGKVSAPTGIHVFKDWFDFLTILTIKKLSKFDYDTIVLNSLSCLIIATPYIKGSGYKIAFTWMANTDQGKDAELNLDKFLVTEPDLKHKPQSGMYLSFMDVNDWHLHNLNLKV